MKMVSLIIDGKEIKAREGQQLLWAALDSGIYIPNLCALRDAPAPHASCRLCWVEIEGKNRPVTACTETVQPGMVVNSRGPAALRLARTGLELLLASNNVDCARCPASGACELQKIAAHLGVKLRARHFRKILRNLPVDASSPLFTYDPNRCVVCGRCVWVCREHLGIGVLGFAHRGFQRRVTTFGDEPIGKSNCDRCGDCVTACPTGALCFKSA
jgi:formate dehydrogenase major subunit/NADH-quinone oxidoreductase subunit G